MCSRPCMALDEAIKGQNLSACLQDPLCSLTLLIKALGVLLQCAACYLLTGLSFADDAGLLLAVKCCCWVGLLRGQILSLNMKNLSFIGLVFYLNMQNLSFIHLVLWCYVMACHHVLQLLICTSKKFGALEFPLDLNGVEKGSALSILNLQEEM